MKIITGSLLLAALVAYLAYALDQAPVWPALLCAWAAAALAWPSVDTAMRRLALALLGCGIALLVAVGLAGGEPDPVRALAINMPIIALFVGITFLGLVGSAAASESDVADAGTAAESGAEPTVTSKALVWRTMSQVHLIGAVINLSMVTIVGDRIQRNNRLSRGQTIALVRAYCAAAFWSPFFVAAAVAITYAPGASLALTIPLGALAALMALSLTAWEVSRLPHEHFVGYRPEAAAVVLSLSLLVAVLGVKALLPTIGIVLIVAALSPPFALALMPKQNMGAQLDNLVRVRLPGTGAQIILFLSAGVFAQGAAVALPQFTNMEALAAWAWNPWAFAFLYSLVVALIIVGAYLAVHPLVSIAALSSLLAPLQPDPSLMAFAILAGWAIGTAAAPLSGINLMMIGRYQVAARDILSWHPGYALKMWLFVTLLIVLVQWWGQVGIR